MAIHGHRHAPGQALVEFALILLVFVMLLVGLFDLGRAVYAYNTLSNAARAAARVAIVNQDTVAITDEAMAQTIGMDPGEVDVDLGALTTGCGSEIEIGCPVEVTIRYRWTAITPLIGGIVGPVDLASTTVMPLENVNP